MPRTRKKAEQHLDTTGTYRIKGSANWYYKVKVGGVWKPVSSHTTDRAEAVRQRTQALSDAVVGVYDPAIYMKVTVEELLKVYVAYLERERKASLITKQIHMKHLTKFMGSLRAYQLGSDKTEAYRAWRKGTSSHMTRKPIADTTVNRELETLIAAYNHGLKRDPPLVKKVPNITLIESAEKDAVRDGTLSLEMYPAVRDAFDCEGVRAMFVVSYEVGMRAGELLKLTWKMVDLEGGYLFLPWRITKNNKSGALPIWGDGDMRAVLEFMRGIQRTFAPNDPDGPVFRRARATGHGVRPGDPVISYREAWERARDKVGLPSLLFHDLRRSTVTNMAIEGFVKEHRQLISRHADEQMEAQYNRTYLETLDLMKRHRAEKRLEVKVIAAPAPSQPVILPPIAEAYDKLTPAQKSLIDGMMSQFQIAS